MYEMIYFDRVTRKMFWTQNDNPKRLVYYENNVVFTWMDNMWVEVDKAFPPNERLPQFEYSEESFKLKT
jgi:hypothetical protein